MGRLAPTLRTDRPNAPVTPRVAVIIPTLNEERSLPATLASLAAQTSPPDRVIVSDGGSADATVELAAARGCVVRRGGRRGRGRQIADALTDVIEDVVVVAHADMIFPPTAMARIREALAKRPDCPGGWLGHRFDRRSPAIGLVDWWDRMRTLWTGVAYGDQGQFFRRDAIALAGGFPDQPIMEDVELSRRLWAVGRPIAIRDPVTVSARRFDRLGYWKTVAINLRLRWEYRRRGLSACERLYEIYYGRRRDAGDSDGR